MMSTFPRVCDPDLRQRLYGSIVLSGGSSNIPGLGERLWHDLQAATRGVRVSKVTAPGYASFCGAAVICSLSNFTDLLVSRQEYEEQGCSVMLTKGA
jgi:actin-related protein